METANNTIFISGGSAGIGLEIARNFNEKGNKVIINGRDEDRLRHALKSLPGAVAMAGDMSIADERVRIVDSLQQQYPQTNIIINNAGTANFYSLDQIKDSFDFAQQEINTNYLAIVHFTELMLPGLLEKERSAIVNVTSQAAYRPFSVAPTYAASKAALHFYTQSLRSALAQSNIKIFELIPPLVNTEFSTAIGGASRGIPPLEVAEELINAFKIDQLDVPVGKAKAIHTVIQNALKTLS
ncbi:SDR family NAD(P)-dependent oxidoreductase [Dyadobacter chenwenxiniae]|uniref:SDR family NAD(P)-dependent oxidoreductase n=1 Tax=Dyadobacter chenwenxiniae TaxID=2906456 RepID=A0A9X1TII3_9BACT|nr:SDR family NAD(P)-dependent oxidoreductase [Dyadobacter chenwenxiniae]MCF0065544.1 SDR family NAD(P)-dependent oxidoreductase [Dyadobacter chenwenxiniae]UON85454.1 SDR family NAD(P)-dependent oxidoreductase [Dyadobacter chenwenxiniae]